MAKTALHHHRVARKAASLSVRALIKMGRVVKKLHEKGYDEKAAKVLLAVSKRLAREAVRFEREASRAKKRATKRKKPRRVKRRRR